MNGTNSFYCANDEWKEYLTPEGKKYWYNTRTKVSSWNKPEQLKTEEEVSLCLFLISLIDYFSRN